jgi:lipoate-protein ligase A
MYLFDLGMLPGQHSMLAFHALARMGEEALVIVSPEVPLASVGYFQDAEQEVDLRYCRESNLPVMRREVGGGATYLDRNQIFYQVIMKRDNPRAPRKIADIYEWFSEAPVATYDRFGIHTQFRPVNDIVTRDGRKIAGEGGGDIGDCLVFVGGILIDFDYERMARVLKVPDEKFRDKVYKTMEENLTTMRRELGDAPPRSEIVRVLAEEFQRLLGPLEPASMTPHLREKIHEVDRALNTDEFLLMKRHHTPTSVKIREGVELHYGMHKARGGLIRTVQEVAEHRIKEIGISGDFTFYPKSSLTELEDDLKETSRREEELTSKIDDFYERKGVESPGVDSDDLVQAMDLEE